MDMRHIDILLKHKRAIDDLTQLGLLDARVLSMIDLHKRAEVEKDRALLAKEFNISRRTLRRRLRFIKTEI